MIGRILGALSWEQIVIWVVGTGGVYAITHLIPSGDLQSALLAIDANLVSILSILFRKPSSDGGSAKK